MYCSCSYCRIESESSISLNVLFLKIKILDDRETTTGRYIYRQSYTTSNPRVLLSTGELPYHNSRSTFTIVCWEI
jgi:hypothetical protein